MPEGLTPIATKRLPADEPSPPSTDADVANTP